MKTWAARGVIAVLLLLIAAELFARFGLGLGDPPLMMADPQIEYLAQPSRSYTRQGHRISYNQWSMRSDDFPAKKADPEEYRVMTLGDSVVNGGSQTDQVDIATEILKRDLAAKLNRRVVVGNISAASWGPPNLLAYVKKYGLFDAEAIVIVLSSHDAGDVPTFEPLGVDAPQRKPVLALQEVVVRYLPRYLPGWLGGAKPSATTDLRAAAEDATRQAREEASLAALSELLQIATTTGARVLIVQHWEEGEIKSGATQPGQDAIARIAEEQNIQRIDLGPAFTESIQNGVNPYRDYIHPNDAGQRILAELILNTITEE